MNRQLAHLFAELGSAHAHVALVLAKIFAQAGLDSLGPFVTTRLRAMQTAAMAGAIEAENLETEFHVRGDQRGEQ